ncbi:MAG: serine hydrolase [Chloroflexota bacterium]|nr:serine hydrolase [Chloroflexota bacterium]MDE2920211.1 serine hydrolase [Chloroflexota bacterium]
MSRRAPPQHDLDDDAWSQDALFARPVRRRPAGIPPPIYHARLRERSAVAKARHAQRNQLRQLASVVFMGLLVIAGILLLVRLLSSVEPPRPDSGRVVNLLSPEASQSGVQRAPTTAPFIDSPFTRPVEAPPISARSALLVDMGERTVVFSKNPAERRPPASLAKLATAIVALEQAPPDTRIQVPESATSEPSALAGLWAGDVLTLEQLLYALLLPSANDAAASIADGIGGHDYTVAQMNDLARRLDLTDTHFANTSGRDAENQYSTAFDLAVLAADAIDRFPLLAKIVATQVYVIPGGPANRAYSVRNLNGLLWTYEGAIGVKTGQTEEAGGNLVVAAQRGSRRLMVVLLGSEDRLADAETLLDFGYRALAARG